MNRMNKLIGVSLAVALATFLAQDFAQAANQVSNARHNRIVGLWDVVATIYGCNGAGPFASFPALHKYELGGTGQVVPATNPAGLSAHMMVWNHLGGNDYLMHMKFFRFDSNGQYIGWVELTNEISISEDATEYLGSGVAQIFDTGGNIVGSSCPELIGTRFTGE